MDETMSMEAWLATRPPVIREAFRLWPPGSRVHVHGHEYYVLGYSETEISERTGKVKDVILLLSEIDPAEDYQEAHRTRTQMCADHFLETEH